MRILALTKETEARLFRARESEDRAVLEAASKIVDDVRKRGDRALSRWAKRLDGMDLTRQGLWISRGEFAAARKRVSREFLRAVEHAARNVRRVAEKQLPREWSLEVEPGVRISQLVQP